MNMILPGLSVDVDTPVHALDPRVKLIGLLAALAAVFSCAQAGQILFVSASFLFLIRIARIPFVPLFNTLKLVASIAALFAVFSLFMTPGTPFLSLWGIVATREGFVVALYRVWGIAMSVLLSGVFSYCTQAGAMAAGVERLLSPLARFGFPAQQLGMTFTIAFRFVPVFMDEIDIITKAQRARGSLSGGGIPAKIRNSVALFVPLMVQAVGRAGELAEAMEARGFVPGAERTRLHPLGLGKKDAIAVVAIAVWYAFVILIPALGGIL